MPRDKFVAVARQFIEGERKHMAEEEAHFLPLAMKTLTEKDWADIDRAVSEIKDPMGDEPSLRFRNIDSHLGG